MNNELQGQKWKNNKKKFLNNNKNISKRKFRKKIIEGFKEGAEFSVELQTQKEARDTSYNQLYDDYNDLVDEYENAYQLGRFTSNDIQQGVVGGPRDISNINALLAQKAIDIRNMINGDFNLTKSDSNIKISTDGKMKNLHESIEDKKQNIKSKYTDVKTYSNNVKKYMKNYEKINVEYKEKQKLIESSILENGMWVGIGIIFSIILVRQLNI